MPLSTRFGPAVPRVPPPEGTTCVSTTRGPGTISGRVSGANGKVNGVLPTGRGAWKRSASGSPGIASASWSIELPCRKPAGVTVPAWIRSDQSCNVPVSRPSVSSISSVQVPFGSSPMSCDSGACGMKEPVYGAWPEVIGTVAWSSKVVPV